MSFFYFLPDAQGQPDAAALAAAGLAYAFDGQPNHCHVTSGPSGGPGVCLHNSLGIPRYLPDRQTWRPILGSPVGAWIGYEVLPGPEDLVRTQTLPGYRVPMADGRTWIAPLARAITSTGDNPFAWETYLPQISTRDLAGRWIPGGVVPRYAELWALATKVFDDFEEAVNPDDGSNEDAPPPDRFDDHHQAAIAALSFNYRISAEEADLLGILSLPAALEVQRALIDWPRRLLLLAGDLQKKTDPGTADS